MIGITLQLKVVLKMRTNLISFASNESGLWYHINIQKAQNMFGDRILHLKMNSCDYIFTLIKMFTFYYCKTTDPYLATKSSNNLWITSCVSSANQQKEATNQDSLFTFFVAKWTNLFLNQCHHWKIEFDLWKIELDGTSWSLGSLLWCPPPKKGDTL